MVEFLDIDDGPLTARQFHHERAYQEQLLLYANCPAWDYDRQVRFCTGPHNGAPSGKPRDELFGVHEASEISSTDVFVWHVVATLSDPLTHATDALLRAFQADVDETHEEAPNPSFSNRGERPISRERSLDRKVLPRIEILLRSAEYFPAGRDRR